MYYIILKKSICSFLLLCSLFLSCTSLSAADLHLFIVADTDASELLPALNYDVKNMRKEARTISQHTGLKVQETILSGSKARATNVIKKLKQLSPQKNDVVLFFYTGHGFRTPSKGNSPWPNLSFSTEEDGIELEIIMNIIDKKGSRLQIVLADLCNSIIPDGIVPMVKDFFEADRFSNAIKENYRKLFLKTTGSITMTSSKPYEYSLALEKGSLFSLTFLEILHDVVKRPTNTVEWQNFLDEVTQVVQVSAQEDHDSEQEPVFLIDIS
jgi:hypothetical protein